MSEDRELPQEPDAALVEGLVKQLFRAENPPDLLWDTKLFESAGRSTDGMSVAGDDVKDGYLKRAHALLLDPDGATS